jgi:chromatin remodeling complex protein RSC6
MAKSSKNVVQEIHQNAKVVNKTEETLVAHTEEQTQPELYEPRKVEYELLVSKLEQTQTDLKTLKAELHKFYSLMAKDFKKANKGRRRANRERSPTGFGKAGEVPVGLRTLLGIEETEHMTRPDVTNKLYAYLDDHQLRDNQDKRIMRADDSIAKAFGLTAEQVKSINSYKKSENGKVEKNKGLNFYNIQRYVAALYKGKPIVVDLVETGDTSDTETHVEETHVVQTPVEQPKQTKSRAKKATV